MLIVTSVMRDLFGVLVDDCHRRRHRHDLVVELAGLLRGRGALLAAHAVFVLLLARNAVALGDVSRRSAASASRSPACASAAPDPSACACSSRSARTRSIRRRRRRRCRPSPAMTRCAAIAIVCRPDEQKRLTVMPGHGDRAAGAHRDLARDVAAGRALRIGAAHDHVFDLAGIELRRARPPPSPRGRPSSRHGSC